MSRIKSVFAATGGILAAVAAAVAILQAGQHLLQHRTPKYVATISPLRKEENMLGHLVAGDDYAKLHDLIGADPDSHFTMGSGYEVFQYDRRWEYIDLLVNDRTVVSLGVYAKSTALKAVLYAGGYPLTLNGPSIARQAGEANMPVDATAGCPTGDAPNWFFEDFMLPMTNQMASYALGWSESTVAIRATAAATLKVPDVVCEDSGSNENQLRCLNLMNGDSTPSQKYLECIKRTGLLEAVNKSSPSVIIINESYHSSFDQLLSIDPSSRGE